MQCEPGWQRAIALVDMNAFFASIEQTDNPYLAGRPVAVTNGLVGTCIITCSYEARAFGIHTGMRIREAKRRCPDLIQRPARPERYAAVSTRIMESLQTITPEVEVFSVDEAFLDVSRCRQIWGTPERIALLIKETVRKASGLTCSVGISGDKSTAKYAAKLRKPDGLTVIPPWQAGEWLRDVAVTELCGVNKGIGGFLARHGAYTCGDVARLPVSVLARRFGNPGRRIWSMCRGEDTEPVQTNVNAPKSMGHGKVMPPDSRDRQVIYMYLIHMAEKVAARLRRHAMQAQRYFIGLKCADGWVGGKFRLACAGNDSRPVIRLCKRVVDEYWDGAGVYQVQVTALDPRSGKGQMDMFSEDRTRSERLNQAMDLINARYGEFAIAPASLLDRSVMPNVIAPGWRPHGHRQSIAAAKGGQKPVIRTVYKLSG